MAGGGEAWLNRIWYGGSRMYLLLMPLSWLFGFVAAVRRMLYRAGLLPSYTVDVPVVVVGNLNAGGTGKTPVVIWLVRELADRGFRPGVVTRGYGGRPGSAPVCVTADGDPAVTGDEPLLIARRTRCPVVVHPDRVAAARALAGQGVDVVVADDGLQHYRLDRQFEIAVVDGRRLLGNGCLLPAGPLREPPSRLAGVDRVLVNGGDAGPIRRLVADAVPVARFTLAPGKALRVGGAGERTLASFRGAPVHALAGIGSPDRFFSLLEAEGLDVHRCPLPDHAEITPSDLDFGDEYEVLMTEKDAVKCAGFAHSRCWYVPVDVTLDDGDAWVDELANRLRPGPDRHD